VIVVGVVGAAVVGVLGAVVGAILKADVGVTGTVVGVVGAVVVVVGTVVSEMGEVVGMTINAWEKRIVELNYWPGLKLCINFYIGYTNRGI
jgi:hypothetical protein